MESGITWLSLDRSKKENLVMRFMSLLAGSLLSFFFHTLEKYVIRDV
jgi:hypothetical protein